MLASLFWFDATLTLYRRWRNKEKLTIAHKEHAYQRIVQSGFSHQKTLIFSLLINLVICGTIWLAYIFKSLLVPLFCINIIMLYTLTTLIDKRYPFKKDILKE